MKGSNSYALPFVRVNRFVTKTLSECHCMKSMLLEGGSRTRSGFFMMNARLCGSLFCIQRRSSKDVVEGFKTSYISETKVGDKRSTMQGF